MSGILKAIYKTNLSVLISDFAQTLIRNNKTPYEISVLREYIWINICQGNQKNEMLFMDIPLRVIHEYSKGCG